MDVGYRPIDTAQAYMNEAGVGEGIKTCGVARENIFVTTKVSAEAKTYGEAAKSIDESLEKMGLSYVAITSERTNALNVRRTSCLRFTKV